MQDSPEKLEGPLNRKALMPHTTDLTAPGSGAPRLRIRSSNHPRIARFHLESLNPKAA